MAETSTLGRYLSLLKVHWGVEEITQTLDTNYLSGVTSVEPSDGGAFFPARREEDKPAEGRGVTRPTIIGAALAVTSRESRIIMDPDRSEPQEGDPRGAFFPAMAVKAALPVDSASIVVFGDSDFASNSHIHKGSKGRLFLNSINWLIGKQTLISIRPKLSPCRNCQSGPAMVDARCME